MSQASFGEGPYSNGAMWVNAHAAWRVSYAATALGPRVAQSIDAAWLFY